MTALRILFALLFNAIPLYGILFLDWSASAVVVLYWFEVFFGFLFTSARIALHRRWTRKRGYWRIPMLADHLRAAFIVMPGLGVFVAVFVAMAGRTDRLPLARLEQGVLALGAAMALQFLLDVPWLRTRSFAWMRAYTERRGGGLLVLFFLLLLAFPALQLTHSALGVVYTMMALKTLWDVFASTSLSRGGGLVARPPGWALKLADLRQRATGGAAQFASKWEASQQKMLEESRHDEDMMPSDAQPAPAPDSRAAPRAPAPPPAAAGGAPQAVALGMPVVLLRPSDDAEPGAGARAALQARTKHDAKDIALALRNDFGAAASALGFRMRFPNFQRNRVDRLEMLHVHFHKGSDNFRIELGVMPMAEVASFCRKWKATLGEELRDDRIETVHCGERCAVLRAPDGGEWFKAADAVDETQPAHDPVVAAIGALHEQATPIFDALAAMPA